MDLRHRLHEEMAAKGIRILCHTIFESVEKRADGKLAATLNSGDMLFADQIMLAIGRIPNTENLGLETIGVKVGVRGEIMVDSHSRTNVGNIWAIGDVTDRVQLTPVAIHEAMCFVETAFKNNPTKPDHDCIPTAVFSQPEIGTVGLSEDAAAKRFAKLEIYSASFRPMRYILAGRQERMLTKLVVDANTRLVLGAHIFGPDAGEMAQLLGIALKAGLSKDDFDRTMAVHPTAAEELVTMYKPSYLVTKGVRSA
jgi:glutathione reductase (NADPH)